MENKNYKPADNTQLRVENELKQLNLEMEYGAVFGGSSDLPLDMESQFLDYVTAFESQYKDVKPTTIYTFLGQPEFKPIEGLNSQEIENELDRLFAIMHANNLNLAVLCDYPPETIYRFITEEFFVEPISDMRIEGMNHNFIYEEFHPNDEYDLKEGVRHFFTTMMNLKSDFKMYFLAPFMATIDNEIVEKGVYEKRIELFRSKYKKLKINELKIVEVEVKDVGEARKFAGVEFYLDYNGVLKTNNETQQIRGRGYLNFVNEDDYWVISRIVFRGFDA
jgi:hypothetical protein